MKALADYVHAKGLKFGLYSDAGTKTCQGRPGSRGYEFQDARQYAAWGVDYLKYDWCSTSTQDARSSYEIMRAALDASGRAIVFSICEWGTSRPWLWGKGVGNLWRTTGDITDKWEGKNKWPNGDCCTYGVTDIMDQEVGLESFAGPGHWNDPDMLEVGNGGMTTAEYRAHFSLWAILAAPLIAGNDLRDMKPEIREILTHKEVIAVDQDPAGSQGRRVRKNGDLEVLKRLFEQHFHSPVERVQPLQGQLGGSGRKIIRLASEKLSAIGILYDVREENVAFLEFSRHFRRHGLPVPEIYAEDLSQGAYLEEDLGDTTLFEFLSKIVPARPSLPRRSRPIAKLWPCCRAFRSKRAAI